LLHSANVSPQINRFLPYPRVRAHAARQLLTRARGCLSWMTSGPGVPLPLLGDGARASGEPRFMLLLRAPRTGLDKDRPLFPLVMQNLQVSRGLVRVKDPCAPLAPGLGECNLLSGILGGKLTLSRLHSREHQSDKGFPCFACSWQHCRACASSLALTHVMTGRKTRTTKCRVDR
jgi:hypothetical protein